MVTALKDVLGAASVAIDGRSQIDAILDAVRRHLGMEIAFAARYVDGRRQFTHIRTDLPVPSAPGDSEPNEVTFCHHILEGRLPELIRNAADFPLARSLPITDALPVGAHMDVPLRMRDGSIYGSFCCLRRTPDYTLTDRDLATLRAFADLAAVQIEEEVEQERSRAAMSERISDAIARGQPRIQFQPIHRLADDHVVGVEALARFGDFADRPPSDWFGEAASVGLGEALELAAVAAAVRALPYIAAPAYMAVNIGPVAILANGLERIVASAPSGRLVIEITEHSQVEDYAALHRALAPLRDHVRIAVDDVGAGYSGLRHILDLKPDILKLDMSLTRDVDRDPARRALIAAMVEFACDSGAALVAEGVERTGERDLLRDLGVRYGQGWLYAPALPPIATQRYLLEHAGASGETPVASLGAPSLTKAVRARHN